MAHTQLSGIEVHGDGGSAARRATRSMRREATRGRGWLSFAVVMFLIAATFNAVYGIAALANDDYFAADELLFGDLSMWGAFYLAVAAFQVAAALLIWARSGFGLGLGIVLAMVSATLALLSIGAYPIWSITAMVVDGLIIYALTVHGFGEEWPATDPPSVSCSG
jgi:hypothetical protein